MSDILHALFTSGPIAMVVPRAQVVGAVPVAHRQAHQALIRTFDALVEAREALGRGDVCACLEALTEVDDLVTSARSGLNVCEES